MLRGLKMYGMAQAVSDLIAQGAPAFDAAVPILSQLLKAEMAEREVRSVAYQIKATGAGFHRFGQFARRRGWPVNFLIIRFLIGLNVGRSVETPHLEGRKMTVRTISN
jgi:hypothetical protein